MNASRGLQSKKSRSKGGSCIGTIWPYIERLRPPNKPSPFFSREVTKASAGAICRSPEAPCCPTSGCGMNAHASCELRDVFFHADSQRSRIPKKRPLVSADTIVFMYGYRDFPFPACFSLRICLHRATYRCSRSNAWNNNRRTRTVFRAPPKDKVRARSSGHGGIAEQVIPATGVEKPGFAAVESLAFWRTGYRIGDIGI